MPKFTSFTLAKTNANFLCSAVPIKYKLLLISFSHFRANRYPIHNVFLHISLVSWSVMFSNSHLHYFSQVIHHSWKIVPPNICNAASLSSLVFKSRSAEVIMKGILSCGVLSLLSVMMTNKISLLLLLSDLSTSTYYLSFHTWMIMSVGKDLWSFLSVTEEYLQQCVSVPQILWFI